MDERFYCGRRFTLCRESAEYLNHENSARRLLRNVSEFRTDALLLRERRPTLFDGLGVHAEDSHMEIRRKVCDGLRKNVMSKEDEIAISRYLKNIELWDLVEGVFHNQIRYEHSKALSEDCFSNATSAVVCERNEISERTLKRIRREGADALKREIQCMFATVRKEDPEIAKEWGLTD